MNARKGLTRADVIISAACLAFVLANVQAISAGGRERSKREVCMVNLRALTAAWQMYAEGNAGKLVNAASFAPGDPVPADADCPPPPPTVDGRTKAKLPLPGDWTYSMHQKELPWIGPGWAYNASHLYGMEGLHQTECHQRVAMESGALWMYLKSDQIYHCPTGEKGELMTCTIIDSMNGVPRGTNAPMAKNINEMKKAAQRIVFIDEGRLTADSYAVWYDKESWFDLPAVPHGDGTSVSFVDGHAEYWKWKAQETVDAANQLLWDYTPITDDGLQDLYRVQIGCWGQLGYTPSVPVE